MEHDCKHDTDIALIQADVENISISIEKIQDTSENIYKILNGNGESGIVTQTALNKSSISRLWWLSGTLSIPFVIGFVIMLIKCYVG